MKKVLTFILLGFISACTAVDMEVPELAETAGKGKIAGTSDLSDESALTVKLEAEAADAVEAGTLDPSELFGGRQLLSFERVFPADSRYEKQTRAAGLNRWYLVRFAEGEDLDGVAESAASCSVVTKVQFTRKAMKATREQPIPLGECGPYIPTKGMVTTDFNDPSFYMQWGLANNADQAVAVTSVAGADINVVPAWEITAGDPSIVVAVIDEAVKYTHPDLAANMWVNPSPNAERSDLHGWNFVDDAPLKWDIEGNSSHGTHVAGIVAAVTNNAIGICGVAGGTGKGDGVRIMSCQIFSGDRGGNDYTIARAIKYAADHGACILQGSYGTPGGELNNDREYLDANPLEFEAIQYFRSKKNCKALDGGAVFFAAGNESYPASDYPGGYKDYISVTAISADYLPAYYTNSGRGCNITAPGGETGGLSGGKRGGILSTIVSELNGEDYGFMQGTSMACPHVSGIAALGLSYALKLGKTFTLDEFNAMILSSVNDVDKYMSGVKKSIKTLELEDFQYKLGTGSIDAYKFLMQVEGTPCVTVTAGKVSSASLDQIFGGGSENRTYTDVEIDETSAAALGLVGAPRVVGGLLQLRCDKVGAGRIKVSAIAGGRKPGTSSSMGGMVITREFAVVSRAVGTSDGRWM
ncbi:MAG: S8 family serine peptidase [Bacteroidales bacterium]|nr:S8 family serine peptidase [Bacteroidales bacterium]